MTDETRGGRETGSQAPSEDDLFFLCYMVERVARRLHRPNSYVVSSVPRGEWERMLSLADVLHAMNPLDVEDDLIEHNALQPGETDVCGVDPELAAVVPTPSQMGRVYARLVLATMRPGEDYVDGLLRVYGDPICRLLDDYETGAFYEPSYVIARAYNEGGF